MPLTADQQAMLQLLLERGQSYADLAAVLGVDEAEVRARARSALTELADTDPDHEVGLTDYLLGQADPIGRADAVRHLKDDPADLALATELSQKLLLLAPQAELPRLPGEERRPRPRRAGTTGGSRLRIPARLRGTSAEPGASASAADGGEAARESRAGISKRQTQLAVAVASGLVLVVVIVLAVTGAFSGGDEAGSAPADSTTAASGGARGFPLSNVQVDKSGDFQNAFTIRQGLQPLLPQTQAIYVTLARKEVVLNAIKTAVNSQKPILPVKGRTIFTGVVNSANAQGGVIPIPLQAAAGIEGTGAAALGVSKARQAIFELRLTGVEQPPKGSAYILWFAVS